jgi:hypothetical protein
MSTPTWAQQARVHMSRGKGDWATVKVHGQTTIAAWYDWQVDTKREGLLSANEYAAANTDARNAEKVKAGWYSFAEYSNDHRHSNDWHGSNIVVLDADAKHGTEEGPDYAFSGDELVNRLEGLHFIALPSHSYTDEVPRWRIIIPLSETITGRAEYAAIARHLAKRLDGYVDPRSYTPEQLWFSMSAPKGEWDKRLGLIKVGG